MKFSIFDFDLTVTKKHTFKNRSHRPENNCKSGIADNMLHHESQISSVATYHDDPNYVALYVAFILKKELTLKQQVLYSHDMLSVYGVEGGADFIISTVLAENFNDNVAYLRRTGKNCQISHILDYARSEQGYSIEEYDVDFYDDSEHNYRCAQNMGINSHFVCGQAKFLYVMQSHTVELPESIHVLSTSSESPSVANLLSMNSCLLREEEGCHVGVSPFMPQR